jgi:hypothetical protein
LTAPLYYEDLAVGQTFGTCTLTVEPEMIKACHRRPVKRSSPWWW